MKYALYAVALCASLRFAAAADTLDIGLDKLASDLAQKITDSPIKKVSVIDFIDLQGNTNELGRYIAEQVSVSLVNSAKGFTVMDRAYLKSVLAEHQLTASGLVNPDNAKKLGSFSGVDAIVLGSVTQLGTVYVITARAIATESSQVVAAARSTVGRTNDADALFVAGAQSTNSNSGVTQATNATVTASPPPKTKIIDNVTFELTSLYFSRAQNQIVATLTITNKKTDGIRLALNAEHGANFPFQDTGIVDEYGTAYGVTGVRGLSLCRSPFAWVRGLQTDRSINHTADIEQELAQYTDLSPGDTITVDLGFMSRQAMSGSIYRFESAIIIASQSRGSWNLSLARPSFTDLHPK